MTSRPATVRKAWPESSSRRSANAIPPVRIAVGSSYKALMQLKRFLPDRLVEFVMRRIYMKP